MIGSTSSALLDHPTGWRPRPAGQVRLDCSAGLCRAVADQKGRVVGASDRGDQQFRPCCRLRAGSAKRRPLSSAAPPRALLVGISPGKTPGSGRRSRTWAIALSKGGVEPLSRSSRMSSKRISSGSGEIRGPASPRTSSTDRGAHAAVRRGCHHHMAALAGTLGNRDRPASTHRERRRRAAAPGDAEGGKRIGQAPSCAGGAVGTTEI